MSSRILNMTMPEELLEAADQASRYQDSQVKLL